MTGANPTDQLNKMTIAAAKADNPYYQAWWMIGGNEPDLGGVSVIDEINLIRAQIDLVDSAISGAKFCVTLGSQLHAPHQADGYFPAVWAGLPQAYKNRIKAFHTHWYTQVKLSLNDSRIYEPSCITNYLNNIKTWMAANAPLPNGKQRQLWLSEVGLIKSTLTDSNSSTNSYPKTVQGACDNAGIQRWAWYGFENIDQYKNLWEAGGITPVGENFNSVQGFQAPDDIE